MSYREVTDIFKRKRSLLEKAKSNAEEKKRRGLEYIKEMLEMDVDEMMAKEPTV